MNNYFENYKTMLSEALDGIDKNSIHEMEMQLTHMAKGGYPILVCGNGGSAAITEHMSCDHTKGICLDTNLNPYIIPLQSNVSLCSAIANDIGYDYVFSKQVEWFNSKVPFGLFVVSSSGNSPNIVNALLEAKKRNIVTMSMVGFDGGKVKDLSQFCIHVKSDNYGIVEDAHQILMHSMAQSIRMNNTNKSFLKL